VKVVRHYLLSAVSSCVFFRRLLTACIVCLCAVSSARAQASNIPLPLLPNTPISLQSLDGAVRAKASPDECFISLGANQPFQLADPTNPDQPCPEGQIPKVNQGYIWGATHVANEIWFGTVPNPLCLLSVGGGGEPFQTDTWVCEFGEGPYSPFPFPAPIGDYRPPRMYVYNTQTRTIQDITPKGTGQFGLDRLVVTTAGIRGAGVTGSGRYVIFAGLDFTSAVNLFAFDRETKEFVAKARLMQFTNMRSFLTAGGVLYASSRLSGGRGGSVIRLRFIPPQGRVVSHENPECLACFQIETLVQLDGDGAYLALHENRLFVSTWQIPGNAGIWMSPPIPAGGLRAADSASWKKVWDTTQYDPDPVVASATSGGALQSFQGYLYWGTLHYPSAAYDAWERTYGPPETSEQRSAARRGTSRAIAIFRGRNFDTTPEIELLYGEENLPVYDPATGQWAPKPNRLPEGSRTPKYGPSGFGNPSNVYTWAMAQWNQKLYIGTLDTSFVSASFGSSNAPPPEVWGADLMVFHDANSPAVPESTTGFGNYLNYGVRNLIPVDDTRLYIGSANPMNLATNKTDALPEGGWELVELTPRPQP
jgi:hypothetical protein